MLARRLLCEIHLRNGHREKATVPTLRKSRREGGRPWILPQRHSANHLPTYPPSDNLTDHRVRVRCYLSGKIPPPPQICSADRQKLHSPFLPFRHRPRSSVAAPASGDARLKTQDAKFKTQGSTHSATSHSWPPRPPGLLRTTSLHWMLVLSVEGEDGAVWEWGAWV